MSKRYDPPPPVPGITGTFRQGGREYDGATLARLTATVRTALHCPNDHEMRIFGEGSTLAVCEEEACPFFGIHYRAFWPGVILEAVQDAPEGVGAKVERASLTVAAELEADDDAGTRQARPRRPLGRLRDLDEQ